MLALCCFHASLFVPKQNSGIINKQTQQEAKRKQQPSVDLEIRQTPTCLCKYIYHQLAHHYRHPLDDFHS